jgi:hypothetical protein
LTAPSVSGFIDYIVYAECSGAPASGKDDKVTLQVPPGTPDKSYALTVDGPSIRPDPPLIEKKPFAVEWNIINSGAAEAPTFNVQLYLDDVQVGEEKEVAKLLPGNSTPVTWTVTKEIVGSPHHVELRNAKNQASLGYREFMVIPGP